MGLVKAVVFVVTGAAVIGYLLAGGRTRSKKEHDGRDHAKIF